MLEVQEEDIDRITGLFHRLLKGELPRPLGLPKDHPENEVRQVVEYANRFVAEYQAPAAALTAVSRGNLDLDVPPGRMHVLQSFKNLHANLSPPDLEDPADRWGRPGPARQLHG